MKKLFREINLNTDNLDGIDVYAAKKQEATGQELVDVINSNPGILWVTTEKPDLEIIKMNCEEIVKRNETGSLQLKMAKQVIKLLKTPRTVQKKRRRR